jgi:hypothetical protein
MAWVGAVVWCSVVVHGWVQCSRRWLMQSTPHVLHYKHCVGHVCTNSGQQRTHLGTSVSYDEREAHVCGCHAQMVLYLVHYSAWGVTTVCLCRWLALHANSAAPSPYLTRQTQHHPRSKAQGSSRCAAAHQSPHPRARRASRCCCCCPRCPQTQPT